MKLNERKEELQKQLQQANGRLVDLRAQTENISVMALKLAGAIEEVDRQIATENSVNTSALAGVKVVEVVK